MRRKITHPIDFQPDVPPGGGQQSPQNGGRGTRLSRRDQINRSVGTADNLVFAYGRFREVNAFRNWGTRDVPSIRRYRSSREERLGEEAGSSYLFQQGSTALRDETLGNLAADAARRWAHKECVISVHQGVRLTFAELLGRADRFAAGLKRLGLERGDRFGIWAPNDVEWIIGFVAAMRAGLVAVSLNPTYQLDEIVYCLQKVGVKAVLSPDNFKTQDYPAMLLRAKRMCPALEHIIIYSRDHVAGTRRFADVEQLASKIEVERVAGEQDRISCHSGSNIQFTSGTTGRPKATLLSHKSLLNNSGQITLLDVYHRVQPPPITLACGITGGAIASPEFFKKIRESFNFDNMKSIYGLTEVSGVIFHSMPNEKNELTDNTVGHLSDHIEAMVVDENGKTVPFGTHGELWIRGYSNMIEYYNDEEATRKTITKDGWFKTGDQFILRSDGYGQIVGRLKELIIRGGENIFPKEIEDVIMMHPLVAEVQVIGAYDKVYGEELCACVRVQDGAKLEKEELKKFCASRIASFKIPRYVEFVTNYPKTSSGKVQKIDNRARENSENMVLESMTMNINDC
ncbi:Acyl-CoA synthetase family member [Apis cerana cerana]|uniref:Medium-chain acyl-CoA ligase ACSF2, mitochondrial n=1 Tax=Apis cerana cerana TaxID=94128 RepID=A0A2A3EE03_APICC|nr:Acyl-CoA synthetase family member [Apis cerana cerana]